MIYAKVKIGSQLGSWVIMESCSDLHLIFYGGWYFIFSFVFFLCLFFLYLRFLDGGRDLLVAPNTYNKVQKFQALENKEAFV